MQEDGVWGDHIMLQAVANALNVNIVVMSSVREREEFITPFDGVVQEEIVLGHYHEVHYVSLQPQHEG